MSKRLEHIYFTGLWFLVVTSTNKGLNFVLVACCAMLLLALPNLSRIKVGAAALILTVSLLGISVASMRNKANRLEELFMRLVDKNIQSADSMKEAGL